MKLETDDDNPWCVDNLNVFLYFCCPECDVKDPSKEIFVKHALEEHPKFKENYENFIKMEYDIIDSSSLKYKRKKQRYKKLKQDDDSNENNNSNAPEIETDEFDNDQTPELNSYIQEDMVKCELKTSYNEISSKNEIIKDELNENGDDEKIEDNDDDDDQQFVHEGQKPFKCGDCGKTFGQQSTLKNHIFAIHKDQEIKGLKRHQCENCDKYFRVPSLLMEHVKIHHEQTKDYNCNYCGKAYALEKYLKCHVEKVHERKNLEEHQCNQCDKTFDFAKYLQNHIKTVHEYKRVVCSQCGKTRTRTKKFQM